MTFYFYDLETSGISAQAQRIMQFAGQRTDMDFNPIGEPDNWLVCLTDEVLPDPDAVMITGITPQKTHAEGYSEAEFIQLFNEHVCQPDTIITGFNSVRFDDEFMRHTLWRNFYDAYEWQWQDGRSRWDLMDVVRMVRALRPDGITWPFAPKRAPSVSEHGKIVTPKEGDVDVSTMVPTNRLELITELNGLSHEHAHDALSDVMATIAVAKLLKDKQPKMFDYLLSMRGKKAVTELINSTDPKPYLYTSGRYGNDWNKTTAVLTIASAENDSVLVYDLRIDPLQFKNMSDEELSEKLFTRDHDAELLPVKVLKPNACPAVAPLGVLDEAAEKNIKLTKEEVAKNYSALLSIDGFGERVGLLFAEQTQIKRAGYASAPDSDFQLYDGFVDGGDKQKMRVVRVADQNTLADLSLEFSDARLAPLLTRYKARNFPRSLTPSERDDWEQYREQRVVHGVRGQLSVAEYGKRLAELAESKTDDESKYLLEELQLYAQSIVPIVED